MPQEKPSLAITSIFLTGTDSHASLDAVGLEAMLGIFVPRDGKVLVLANGAYGLRAAETLRYLGRAYTLIDKGDYMPPRGPKSQLRWRRTPRSPMS